jgi:hypothetical protein
MLVVKEERLKELEAIRAEEATACVAQVLRSVSVAGYDSLYSFLHELMNTKDRGQSSQVSQLLIAHGDELLDSICAQQPSMTHTWVRKASGELLAEEGKQLAQLLRPPHGQPVTHILSNFSLD